MADVSDQCWVEIGIYRDEETRVIIYGNLAGIKSMSEMIAAAPLGEEIDLRFTVVRNLTGLELVLRKARSCSADVDGDTLRIDIDQESTEREFVPLVSAEAPSHSYLEAKSKTIDEIVVSVDEYPAGFASRFEFSAGENRG